jgi:exonuclease VII large subunit
MSDKYSGDFFRGRHHRLEVMEHKMQSVMQFRLRRSHDAFGRIAHTLDALSPLAALERGYAVCLTPEGAGRSKRVCCGVELFNKSPAAQRNS